jgi:hypothetical protein
VAEGTPALDRYAAARLTVVVVTNSDERVTAPWLQKAEKGADAVAAALSQAGFRTTRGLSFSWDVRVSVAAPLRGADLEVMVEARHKVLDRLGVKGADWGPEELAELAKVVRQRMERSEAVAALAGIPPRKPEPAAAAPQPAQAPAAPASAAPAGKRLAVLDFRGAVPPQVLALLADQARAAAADAGRTSGTAVMIREAVVAALKEKGRAAEPCADAACELETARAAGAALVVTGEVTALGEARILVMKLVDTASGSLVASRQAQGKDDLSLVEAARSAATALFQ